ncbi:MAG: aldehyde dehydrogenase family protein [Gammaproteobacteria bacterium]|nr:aldehyde dehydrogenase family protein [Gammaproteobacteria bacterium]
MLDLKPGSAVLSPHGRAFVVDDALASAFRPGDRVLANDVAGLLHVPEQELTRARDAVDRAAGAFEAMHAVADDAVVAFYGEAARALEDDGVWKRIATVNAEDVASARRRGRSTTRLGVSDAMRAKMIEGLSGWAAMPSRRGAVLEAVQHDGFRIEMIGAALGIVAFVFEGRPNVLADACGVLRGGNTVVFRIGADALGTARAIMSCAIEPALVAAGLPAGAVSLLDSKAHAAGWALFMDSRLALAVARGSGHAVKTLGSLAQSVGTPVSLHGTGGAWIMVSQYAPDRDVHDAVVRSLDRKVCNTLNTCCVVGGAEGAHRGSIVLGALQEAAQARGHPYKLHVVEGSEGLVPAELFEQTVNIVRAEGPVAEPQAEPIAIDSLGTEWEWEEAPEITLLSVDSIDEAVGLFNRYSPRLVASLISSAPAEQERFFSAVDAPFSGDGHTRWVDGQFALNKPELGLSNWENGRLFGRSGVLTGDSVYTVRTRYVTE